MLNPNMEFYKLAGIGDIGEIVVHLDIRPENDKRGVTGGDSVAGAALGPDRHAGRRHGPDQPHEGLCGDP
jgi:hypothetical protein